MLERLGRIEGQLGRVCGSISTINWLAVPLVFALHFVPRPYHIFNNLTQHRSYHLTTENHRFDRVKI
ncbi:hypothetical protein K440DRAFT_323811 [Wilcoxina mikolae CBS 423.85]|nr:hypothetical protein K440DRAFT_323811 [Wilcoxina mikolae CBS 423.85]